MKIAGLVKSSLIDYPGKVAAVVFTQGCNFHCGFCHNPDLIPIDSEASIATDEVLAFLEKRKNILDGIVITGGEPMVQPDLSLFMKRLKDMGYLVKLDTNGSNPGALAKVISDGLVDYIAMDIKGPLENYENICGHIDTAKISESIGIIMDSGLDYEFRTTVLPHYHALSDFHKVGELIKGAKCYTIQGFRPQITYDKKLSTERSFTLDELSEIAEIMKKYVSKVVVHDNLGV